MDSKEKDAIISGAVEGTTHKSSADKFDDIDKAFEKYSKSLKDVLGINVPHTLGVIDKLIGDLKTRVEEICDRD